LTGIGGARLPLADAAADAAATLDLPLTLTARGCVVYAAKAPRS
jgi:hypothetical protein